MKSIPNAFVDTNVLVYAADERASMDRRTRIARELLLKPRLHLSVQVLNEFIAVARHPQKLNFTKLQEMEWLGMWLQNHVMPITAETFLKALEIHASHQLSHWDSLIIASATEAHCTILYSEDLNYGQNYGSVQVINPFL